MYCGGVSNRRCQPALIDPFFEFLAIVGLPLLVLLVVASAVLYFLPTVIAAARHKQNTLSIFLLNLFLGWSFIGWVVALVWAVSVDRA